MTTAVDLTEPVADRPWLATLGWTTVLYGLAALAVGASASIGGFLIGGAVASPAEHMLAFDDIRRLAVIAFGGGIAAAVLARPGRRDGWLITAGGTLLAATVLVAWRFVNGDIRALTISTDGSSGAAWSLILIVLGLGAAIGGVLAVAVAADRQEAPVLLVALLLGGVLRPAVNPERQTALVLVALAAVFVAIIATAVERPGLTDTATELSVPTGRHRRSTAGPSLRSGTAGPGLLSGTAGPSFRSGTAGPGLRPGRRILATLCLLVGVQVFAFVVDEIIDHRYGAILVDLTGTAPDLITSRTGFAGQTLLLLLMVTALGWYAWQRGGVVAIRFVSVALVLGITLAVWIVADPRSHARLTLFAATAATAAAAWLASSRVTSRIAWDAAGVVLATVGVALTVHTSPDTRSTIGVALAVGGAVFALVAVVVKDTRSDLPRLGAIETVCGVIALVWGARLVVGAVEALLWTLPESTRDGSAFARPYDWITWILLVAPMAVAAITIGTVARRVAARRAASTRKRPVPDSG